MASKQQLKEANYVHYNDYKEGRKTCGLFSCDYSKVVKDDITGEEYRYCTKLQMYVGDYDLCKYYNDKAKTDLLVELANLIQEENEITSKPKQETKKKNYWIAILIIVCICVFIYIRMK